MGHIINRINYRYKLAKKRAETAEKLAKEFEAAQMQWQETDYKTGEPYPKEQQGKWPGEISGIIDQYGAADGLNLKDHAEASQPTVHWPSPPPGTMAELVNQRWEQEKKAEAVSVDSMGEPAACQERQETDWKTGEPYPKEQQGVWGTDLDDTMNKLGPEVVEVKTAPPSSIDRTREAIRQEMQADMTRAIDHERKYGERWHGMLHQIAAALELPDGYKLADIIPAIKYLQTENAGLKQVAADAKASLESAQAVYTDICKALKVAEGDDAALIPAITVLRFKAALNAGYTAADLDAKWGLGKIEALKDKPPSMAFYAATMDAKFAEGARQERERILGIILDYQIATQAQRDPGPFGPRNAMLTARYGAAGEIALRITKEETPDTAQ